MNLQRQAQQDLLSLYKEHMNADPYESYAIEKEKPWWQKLIGGAFPVTGAAAGGLFGGPSGAAMGGKIGSQIGQGFF
jgi:hypothetical protein